MRKLIQPDHAAMSHLSSSEHQKQQNKAHLAHESAKQHVAGSALYIDDLPEPANLKHAAVGLSTIAAGQLTQLDLASVATATGVVDVITVTDIPGETDIGPVFKGDPILVSEDVSFFGQPIFAVLADSIRAARQACAHAVMQFSETDPCLTSAQSHQHNQFVRPKHTMLRGDYQQALTNGDIQVTGELHVGGQEHFYLEGQVAMAVYGEDDNITVYSSTQHPSEVQKLVAEVLNVRLHKVNVEIRRMGGAFGGKETQGAQWACLAAVLAKRNRCAVKLRLPRATDMIATGKRHPFCNQYQISADANGVIQGTQLEINGICGHSPDLSDAIVDRAMFHCDNAYHLGDCLVQGHRCRTNMVSHTAFRGFGGPQGMIMAEAMLDRIARAVGKDPLTVRKHNLYHAQPGRDTTQYGMEVEHFVLDDIISELENRADYWQRREQIRTFNQANPVIKKGLALTPVKFGISFTAKHLNQAGALVHIYTDGSIQVNHGGTEMGQGLHTKIQHIAAHEFGLPLAFIEVTATRTDKVPNTSPTAASSGTDLNGKAVQDACFTLKHRLAELALTLTQQSATLTPDDVIFAAGQVRCGDTCWAFAELVQKAYFERIQLSASGFYRTPKIEYNRDTGKGRPFFYFANGAAVSEVSVDTLTGEHKVDRVDILHDVGTSINPAIDIGQIEGGFIQGMGWLTCEELVWDDTGKLLTQGPATYKIPSIGDLPAEFNVALFEQANPEHTIYHSKAVGEPPFMLAISVWCALKDALSSLTDYRVDPDLHLPATPESVINAIASLTGGEPASGEPQ